MVKTIFKLLCACCCMAGAHAQHGCLIKTELGTRTVYPQQPFKVTFTVLTPTWYTEPLEFENLEIPNAFIIPFEQTRPGMFNLGGKQYAGLSFYYIVFPYAAGRFTIPAVRVVATTPPEGSSKPGKVILRTIPQKFDVMPIPATYTGEWFVARDVRVSEHWNRPLRNLKVGDVIERTVVEYAAGTLPQFIPDLKPAALPWASTYMHEATFQDKRDEFDANGVRTQKITYLLEKAGDFSLPALRVTWWNPYARRVSNKSLATPRIHVAQNPDLGILATLKDSLNNASAIPAPDRKDKVPFLINGIPWYLFVLYVLAALVAIGALARASGRLYRRMRARYRLYKRSERYWFGRFLRSSQQFPAVLNALYAWWDRLATTTKSPSMIAESIADQKDAEVAGNMATFYGQALNGETPQRNAPVTLRRSVRRFRTIMLQKARVADTKVSPYQQPWPCDE